MVAEGGQSITSHTYHGMEENEISAIQHLYIETDGFRQMTFIATLCWETGDIVI